jgi:CheY-like chemotaxis protein
MHILAVDDDSMVLALVSCILEDAGFQVTICGSGIEAMQIVGADKSIAAIVSDLHMPGMDGIELFNQLRDEGCELPFVLMSADDPSVILKRAPAINVCLVKDEGLTDVIAPVIKRLVGDGGDA